MNTILLILCNALSCFIISTILFQFMNGKYKKSSQSRYVYIVIETVTVIFTTCINMLNHSILNLVVWGVLTGIIAYALYYEDMDKPLRRIIECEALVICMSVCESLGVILLQCILQAADIKNVNETMLYCLEVTFSKVILIFLYYRNLLGGLYRENPVKSRKYEAVKSSKKWENVGNSYIIPALLLYRYSYI